MCEICSKLKIKMPERFNLVIFPVKFEQDFIVEFGHILISTIIPANLFKVEIKTLKLILRTLLMALLLTLG